MSHPPNLRIGAACERCDHWNQHTGKCQRHERPTERFAVCDDYESTLYDEVQHMNRVLEAQPEEDRTDG